MIGAENGEVDADSFQVSDATYVKNTFVTFTCEDYESDIDYKGTSVIRVLSDNGEILRKIQLKGQFLFVNIVLVNESKLLVDFEDEECLHMFDLKDLLVPGTNEIYAKLNIKSKATAEPGDHFKCR